MYHGFIAFHALYMNISPEPGLQSLKDKGASIHVEYSAGYSGISNTHINARN